MVNTGSIRIIISHVLRGVIFLALLISLSRTQASDLLIVKDKEIRLAPENLAGVQFIPEKRLIAGVYEKGAGILWDLEGKQVGEYHNERYPLKVRTSCFSPDAKLLSLAPAKGSVRLIDLSPPGKSLSENFFLPWDDSITAMSFSPDSKNLAVGSLNGDIKLWDCKSKALIKYFSAHDLFITDICFAPRSATLATASGDKTIKLWNLQSGKLIRTLQEPLAANVLYFVQGKDKPLKANPIGSGNSPIISLNFSPDGKLVAGGTGRGDVLLFDMDTGSIVKKSEIEKSPVTSLIFTKDNRFIICGTLSGNVHICGIRENLDYRSEYSHNGPVSFMEIIEDSSQLITGSINGNIIFWKMTW